MRFVTCRLPDGVEDPAILSPDGTQIWPLSWLGLSYREDVYDYNSWLK